MYVASKFQWLTSCASKWGGGPKAVLVSSGGAQNCASKLQVTILLRDPFTIPEWGVGVGTQQTRQHLAVKVDCY